MGKVFDEIDDKLAAWIKRQRMFFVGTAPSGGDGHVNVSPKGPIESLRILGPRRVGYVDLIGSGAETAAHVCENGRIVIMLCAFEGPPRIVRLHGRGDVVQIGEPGFTQLKAQFDLDSVQAAEAARAIVVVEIDRVADSCGYGVPLMHYEGERPQQLAWIESKLRRGGDDALMDYVADRNEISIDGLPAFAPETLPRRAEPSPPSSLLLVHGAGSGPWVYDEWPEAFPSLRVAAVDLQEGLEVGTASMSDYADRVVAAARALPRPVSLCGWSMGGLAVVQAAARARPHSVILIEPSPPGEVQGFDADVAMVAGTFDPEDVYGRFPAGVPARPESSLARAERKRGISVPELPCPSLVIYGDEFGDERGTPIASLYGSEERDFPGLDHWDLVRNSRVREAIADYLGAFRPVSSA